MAPSTFAIFPVCTSDRFFFSTVIARSSESTVSASSFSEATKTSCSLSRMPLASASSFSDVEIFVVSSSMELVSVRTDAFASSIVASRSPIVRFELVIASSFVFASSSHQEVYSSMSDSSLARSASTFPFSSSRSWMTFCTGLTCAADAPTKRQRKKWTITARTAKACRAYLSF